MSFDLDTSAALLAVLASAAYLLRGLLPPRRGSSC